MLATIAAQDLIKSSQNIKAALAKKAAGVKLGTPGKTPAQIEQIYRLRGRGTSNYVIDKVMKMSASTVAKYVAG